MTKKELLQLIKLRQSFLCVGLDPDPSRIELNKILDFNKKIIDSTFDLCVAYKPNIAFYEYLGSAGWEILKSTINYIGKEHFIIADAKRGDIGNTCNFYAKTYFETYDFDAVTINPYMGIDSIKPFLDYENKWSIVLSLTSNSSSSDFQTPYLWKEVINKCSQISSSENCMFVIGATKAEILKEVREIVPNHFLLIPGVGEQGGNLDDVCEWGMNSECGLIVNSSRQIIYSDDPRKEAQNIRDKMSIYLSKLI